MSPVWAVGLMTGTVLDGQIDVALIRTDGKRVAEFGAFELISNPPELNGLLESALNAAREWRFVGPEPEIFSKAERALTNAQSRAVLDVVARAGLGMDQIRVVGFHGQTVLHRAPTAERPGATRQLGDGALMAQRIGADVVFDLRSCDVAAGGQGAPLAPVYHAALLDSICADADTAVLNLGGVANLTWRSDDGTIIGFDTGPANAPINDFVRARGLGAMDRDGELARQGQVDEALLESRLDHPYLSQSYPKSLDRFDFGHTWVGGLSNEDGVTTLTAFSAAAVGKALDILPIRPTRLIVSGGGRRNPSLMAELERRTCAAVSPAEDVGWRGDAIEAECFAFLAVRSLGALPLSFPTTTGVHAARTGGRIAEYTRQE